ncbi:MAG: class I SAM-dependent methyltransferase [Deltaproteobacteria bacterium]|nr:class I SAM-dependent methyltransferase [Deltaproteobacteria bacterium]
MSIINYYNKEAKQYNEKFSRGLLGWMRQSERRVIYDLLNPCHGENILDAGCGSGFDMIRLKSYGSNLKGVDLNHGMVAAARERGLDVLQGALEDFALHELFDKILCAGVFEFCTNHHKILLNLKKHLNPKGELILFMPRSNTLGKLYKLYHWFNKNKITLFSLDQIHRLCGDAGLAVVTIEKAGPFGWAARIKSKQCDNALIS